MQLSSVIKQRSSELAKTRCLLIPPGISRDFSSNPSRQRGRSLSMALDLRFCVVAGVGFEPT
jgi:hypothetical protein